VVLAAAGIVAAAVIARGDDARRVQTGVPAETTVDATGTSVTSSTGLATSSTAEAAAAATAPTLQIERRTVTEPSYSYELQFPTVVGLPTAVTKNINDELRKVVDGYVAVFTNGVDPRFVPGKMRLSVTAPAVLDGYFSVRFDVFMEWTGADSSRRVTARTFDTSDGTSQPLEQFAGGVQSRPRLQEIIADALRSKYPDLFTVRAADIAELSGASFAAWYPGTDGVHLAFDQGALAARPDGILEVVLDPSVRALSPSAPTVATKRQSGRDQHATWNVESPTVTFADPDLTHEAQAEIDGALQAKINSFRQQAAEIWNSYPPGSAPAELSQPAELTITLAGVTTTNNLVSLELDWADFANWASDGGGHGVITRTFSPKGKPVTLALLTPEPQISDAILAAVRATPGVDPDLTIAKIGRGTAQDWNWITTAAGVEVLFDQDVIAGHAAGGVRVPLSEEALTPKS
jgi:hypothetical protein